jgi:AsmA protein
MRSKVLLSRLSTLILALLACLLLALFAPYVATYRALEEPFSGASVMASPRDLHVVAQPVQLSRAPDLVLNRGILYADGNAATGAPISRFVLDGPLFTLNASGHAAATVLADENSVTALVAPLIEQLTALSFDTLIIRHGTLNVTTTDGELEVVSGIEAELANRRKGSISGKGTFMVRGHRLTFDGSLAPPDDKPALSRWPLKLTVKGPLLEASLYGHLDAAEDLRLSGLTDISIESVRRAARWFSVPVPTAEGVNRAALKGQFTWARRTLAIEEAKVSIDGNEATGTLALNVAGERPLIDGTLAFSSLELGPYLEAARSQSFVFDRQTASWSEFDLSFPIIRHIDTDLRISAPKVTMKGYDFGRAAATITVRDGKLLADVAELELPTGSASAQITADVSALVPLYTLRARVENFEAGPVATALFGASLVTGRSVLSMELTSSGQTPAELLRRLCGKSTLRMPEGGKLALDLKALRSAAKGGGKGGAQSSANSGTESGEGAAALTKGQTSVQQIEVQLRIEDGVLMTDTALARSDTSGLLASGQVDLSARTMDVKLIAKANPPQDRPLAPADLSGGDMIAVRGAWNAPAVESIAADGPRP